MQIDCYVNAWSMNMSPENREFVRVYRAANGTEAHLIKGMLEQHGMLVRIFGDGLSSGVGELPVDVMQVEIQVKRGYRKLARQLILEYESRGRESDVEDARWICPKCKEENPVAFDICWNCRESIGA